MPRRIGVRSGESEARPRDQRTWRRPPRFEADRRPQELNAKAAERARCRDSSELWRHSCCSTRADANQQRRVARMHPMAFPHSAHAAGQAPYPGCQPVSEVAVTASLTTTPLDRASPDFLVVAIVSSSVACPARSCRACIACIARLPFRRSHRGGRGICEPVEAAVKHRDGLAPANSEPKIQGRNRARARGGR